MCVKSPKEKNLPVQYYVILYNTMLLAVHFSADDFIIKPELVKKVKQNMIKQEYKR